MKEKRWWGVTYANCDEVMPDTIRRTRKDAMRACCDNRYRYRDDPEDWRSKWEKWNAAGCKAVRVVVRREA